MTTLKLARSGTYDVIHAAWHHMNPRVHHHNKSALVCLQEGDLQPMEEVCSRYRCCQRVSMKLMGEMVRPESLTKQY